MADPYYAEIRMMAFDNSFRVPDIPDRTPVQRDARNGLQIGRSGRIRFDYADDGQQFQEFLYLTFIYRNARA